MLLLLLLSYTLLHYAYVKWLFEGSDLSQNISVKSWTNTYICVLFSESSRTMCCQMMFFLYLECYYLQFVATLSIPHSAGELVFSCPLIEQLSNLLDNRTEQRCVCLCACMRACLCVFFKRGVLLLWLCVSSASSGPWQFIIKIDRTTLASHCSQGPCWTKTDGQVTSRHKDKQTWSFYNR